MLFRRVRAALAAWLLLPDFNRSAKLKNPALNFDLTISRREQGRGLSKPRRLGEIGVEAVTSAVIFARHFGRSVPQLLFASLVDLRRRVAREFKSSPDLGGVATPAGGNRGSLD